MNREPLYFIAGLAVGAAGMYFGMKSYFENMVDEEVDNVKLYYDKKIKKLESENSSVEEIEEEVIEEPVKKSKKVERPKIDDAAIDDYEEQVDKLNYNTYFKGTSSLSDKPYIISANEYGDTKYEQKIISYFADDEVLMDSETEEVIDDINHTVGVDNLECLSGDDNREIYVRNEKRGQEYQVVLEPGSYEDFISGQEDW